MNDNRLCNKCGLLPQTGTKPQPPCKPKCACKPKCRKDCCGEGFVFRKITIPAALGDDKTGEMIPRNGLYCNALVSYEASSVQYMYDSYGVPSKVASFDFKDMTNVPTYDGVPLNYVSRIPSVEKAVAEEARIREQVDDNLQEQIDAIAAGSDVTDIVGTYSELLNYDTSKLHDNDIIKVLQDETQDDATTYYRYDKDTGAFSLIGQEGPYYTKAQADSKFQDKLIAGDGITINEDNVISSTEFSDGTYLTEGTLATDIHSTTILTTADIPSLNVADIVIGETQVYDMDGTVGVITNYTDPNIIVTTITTAGSGDEGTAKYNYTTNIAVGGIPVGTEIHETDLLADIIKQMLVTTYYPTFVAPSATLTYVVDNYIKVGDSVASKDARINYNAGAINLQGVKQNDRGGAATGYSIATTGADTEYSNSGPTNTFTIPSLTRSTKGSITLTGTVSYGEGPQPLDSNGNPYGSPLPAGTVTATKTFNFIQPFYWGKSSGSTISDFTGLTESVTPKGQKTVSYTTDNEHMVFAYDSSYGDLVSILDPNSFETISGWSKSTLTVGGFEYNVYIADSATTDTNAEFTFKF